MTHRSSISMAISFLFVLLLSMPSAAAEPVAPLPEMTEQGRQMLKTQGLTVSDIQKTIPSKASVPLPIYPGACFVSKVKGRKGGAIPMLPAINLVSADSPETIEAWYRNKLSGWTYDDTFALFHDSKQKVDMGSLMSMPTIAIMAEEDPGFDLVYYNTDNIKSRIIIRYKPEE